MNTHIHTPSLARLPSFSLDGTGNSRTACRCPSDPACFVSRGFVRIDGVLCRWLVVGTSSRSSKTLDCTAASRSKVCLCGASFVGAVARGRCRYLRGRLDARGFGLARWMEYVSVMTK
jgi:hypothetical protein